MTSPRRPELHDPDLVIRRALDARDAGRAAEGVAMVKAALKRHPKNAVLWQTLGLLRRSLEDSAAAIEAFRKASLLAPADPKIAHGLARVTMEAGLPSLDLFERARLLAPLDGDLLASRAAAQLAEGKGKQAIDELDELLVGSPQWIQGQALLANLRWMLGEKEAFTSGYDRALRQQPADLNLWLSLIDRLIQAGMFPAADDAVARARSAVGSHLALDANEAICASELGDVPRADDCFARLNHVQDVAFAVRHVRHLLRTGRILEAANRAEPLTRQAGAELVWPYVAVIWRLLDDKRWHWLEDDPRLIGIYDIAGDAMLRPLADCLRSLHNTARYPIGQSVRGGTQTDGPLFARIDPEIRALRKLIVRTVETHISKFGEGDPTHPVLSRRRDAPIRFAGSWSVRLSGAGHHTRHIHPQGWLSSAFYVTVPDQSELGPPPAGWLSIGQPPAELGIDLPPFRTIETKPGRLVLFPSIMWHGTVPFEGGERMTVAFDVAPPP
ncbi:MAG TPA: putative 2OG-Fe(II) oxygenase [Sphingomicrobium sp.]|nr:putative 2OG-Fe(II) oxygenase [Sphingomicrobium sp.]